jgi:hypothetical protein
LENLLSSSWRDIPNYYGLAAFVLRWTSNMLVLHLEVCRCVFLSTLVALGSTSTVNLKVHRCCIWKYVLLYFGSTLVMH